MHAGRHVNTRRTLKQRGRSACRLCRWSANDTDLRQLQGHKAGNSRAKKMNNFFAAFEIHHSFVAAGWGGALDLLYDEIGEALERITSVLLEGCDP